MSQKRFLLFFLSFLVVSLACNLSFTRQHPLEAVSLSAATTSATLRPARPSPTVDEADHPVLNRVESKWDLWNSGETMLRGANIWQALVVPELDGPEFKGSGPFGPPFTQADFDHFADLGANYVVISGPGLFTENPPFELDARAQQLYDDLLAMIAQADLFATIAFRTGPGRSEYGLCCRGEDWAEGYFNDTAWVDQSAQDAWVEMWRYTADRYKDNPVVVGYKLMVEPNANGLFLEVWEPEEFYPRYANTSYDWNQWYPEIVRAIRSVDPDTPILVNGSSYSAVAWLPYLEVLEEARVVYIVHQYAPHAYTHQAEQGANSYPGYFDADYDGQEEVFDRQWLDNLLGTVDQFTAEHDVPVGVDEFGVIRWLPGAPEFLSDEIGLFEQLGWNYAIWEWASSWEMFAHSVTAFNFRYGTNPENKTDLANPLQMVIQDYWQLNAVRPSNVLWGTSGE